MSRRTWLAIERTFFDASSRTGNRELRAVSGAANSGEKGFSQVLCLSRTNAADAVQFAHSCGPYPRHLAERGVVKDDVRRHPARPRNLEAHRAKPLEEIAIDVLPGVSFDARALGKVASIRARTGNAAVKA